MSWTTPRTWTTGDTITAALLNTHLRDNLNYLYDPPGCLAIRTSNQSITSGSQTVVNFNSTDVFDTDTMHDTSTNPDRITPNTSGAYVVSLNIEFAPNSTGFRRAWISNTDPTTNVGTVASFSCGNAGSTENTILSCTGIAKILVSGSSWFDNSVYQTSGGALNILGSSSVADNLSQVVPCSFGATWVGNA